MSHQGDLVPPGSAAHLHRRRGSNAAHPQLQEHPLDSRCCDCGTRHGRVHHLVSCHMCSPSGLQNARAPAHVTPGNTTSYAPHVLQLPLLGRYTPGCAATGERLWSRGACKTLVKPCLQCCSAISWAGKCLQCCFYMHAGPSNCGSLVGCSRWLRHLVRFIDVLRAT